MRRLFLLLVLLAPWILLIQALHLDDTLQLALCIARCPEDQCTKKCNETTNTTAKIPFIQTTSKSNVSLQCKDVDRLVLKHEPGIYVIEIKNSTDSNWTSPIISNDTFYEFMDLNPGSRYKYRIRKVTSKGVTLPEITQWFNTNDENYIPKEVKNISVSKFDVNKNRRGHMETYINIVPADDLNCLYNVIHWGGEHNLYQYHLDATREYRLKIRHLKYYKNNTVYVISRNELGSLQSNNVTLTFMTPSCLTLHHNLDICDPLPVTGLHVTFETNKNSVDLQVSWNKPELQPNNYTVVIQPLELEKRIAEVTAFGNETMVNISKVALSHQYKIGVVAESKGGRSLQWNTFTREENLSVGSQVVIATSTLTTLVFGVVFIYTYCRYKRLKGHDCKYSFFENINRKANAFEDVKSPLKTLSAYDTDENSKLRDKFEIQVDRLSIIKILGHGNSGVVKLATLQDDKKETINVAVKMLRENASAEDIRNFRREILLMKSAGNHPNIVSIIGCCTLSTTPLLVVEYCSEGDLLIYLRTIMKEMMRTAFKQVECTAIAEVSSLLQRDSNNFAFTINNRLYDIQQGVGIESKLSPEDLLNFARQVASGMEFLSSNRIVHRDLAARNVLVCADGTVKISDFGLSRDIYQENVYKKQTNGKLPTKWMAIEALTHQVYTTQSDVWSFGVLLYEIVTLGGDPYPGLLGSEILHLLKSGYRMERPSNCGVEFYEIMRLCWHENPLNRPTFYNLKQQLDKLLSTATKNEYLNLSELRREPAAQHRRFIKLERKTSNILTIPNII